MPAQVIELGSQLLWTPSPFPDRLTASDFAVQALSSFWQQQQVIQRPQPYCGYSKPGQTGRHGSWWVHQSARVLPRDGRAGWQTRRGDSEMIRDTCISGANPQAAMLTLSACQPTSTCCGCATAGLCR